MHPIIAADLKEILESNIPWNIFSGKSVLVTGGNGFIASYLIEALLALNKSDQISAPVKVFSAVRNIKKAALRFKSSIGDKNFYLVEQDVSEKLKLSFRSDYIVHAASQASPKYYGVDPVGTLKANVLGTQALLDYAREVGSEGFLFFSSAEIYGDPVDSGKHLSEWDYGYLDPTNIRACYAESKRMGETMCVSWEKQYGVSTNIVRPFHTYGPGMATDDGRVFADFVASAVKGEPLQMKSDGSAIRSYCYLTDAIIGYFKVLLQGQSSLAYNVGNEAETYSVAQLAEIISNIFPERNIRVEMKGSDQLAAYLKSAVSRITPSTKRLQALGWAPKISVQEGFRRTILSFS